MKGLSIRSYLLVLLALGAVAYIAYDELQDIGMSKEGFIFPSLRVEDLSKIKIKNKFGTFTLVNQGENNNYSYDEAAWKNWRLENLPNSRLNKEALRYLQNNILQLNVNDPFEPNEKLANYGLEKPEIVLTIVYRGGEKTLLIGDYSEFLKGIFAKFLGEKRLFMLDDALIKILTKPEAIYRDPQILPYDVNKIEKLEFRGPDGEIELAKEGQDWFINKPKRYPADKKAVSMLLATLRAMQTATFFDLSKNKLEDVGLNEPFISFKMKVDGIEARLDISEPREIDGTTQAFAYLEGESHFSSIDNKTIGIFPVGLNVLRQKGFITIAKDDIEEFLVTKNIGENIVGKKTEQGWKINEKDGDQIFIDKFLQDVTKLEAERFIDEEDKPDFNNPLLVVTVKSVSGEEKVEVASNLKVLTNGAIYYYAHTITAAGQSEDFIIPERVFKHLSPQAELLER